MKAAIAAALMGSLFAGFALVGDASAERKKGESYAACKNRISKEPPCNARWSNWCVAQCGGK